MTFKNTLQTNIKASAAIVQVVSHETLRIRADCTKVAKDLKRDLFVWSYPQGVKQIRSESAPHTFDDELTQPQEILDWLQEHSVEPSDGFILLLEDFHHFLSNVDHALISRLRAFSIAVASQEVSNCTVVLSQPIPLLPPELEKEVQVLEMPLPGIEEIEKLIDQAAQKFALDDRDVDKSPELLASALGLSTSEAQLAFAKVACEHHRLTDQEIPYIVGEKEQVIRKSGHLEYFHPKSTLDQVGGLDNLKNWLKRRQQSFTEDAKDFGLDTPRGILLLGLPGTGKSLAAKAVANAWRLPLLRLDMGKIYGGIVGQSEENMRAALQTAEALAPSILWVDEIEKGLSGMQSSGSTDGGTTSRVLGTFLTWMQEKEKPVFVVATANQIASLPPELLRKGRVDEIFFVDLPVQKDRKEILSIHLKKKKRLDDFNDSQMEDLATLSAGFTGAELEEAVKEGMFIAFDEARQLDVKHIKQAIESTSPLSKTMHEMIRDTRKWAKGRAVSASSSDPEPLAKVKQETPRLRQEGVNPFISGEK